MMSNQKLQDAIPHLQIVWNALVRRDILPEKADAIVIGGCRDLGVAERAAEIYHAGITKTIIVSGYKPKWLDITEAKLLAGRCIELGVPREALILEEQASNTGENITRSAEILGDVKSVILVHKPYTSLRFLATAQAQWPNPQPQLYITCQNISFEDYCEIHGIEEAAYKMLGDMKRMDEYVGEGYQTYQFISDEARAAYRQLVLDGIESR